MSTDTTVTVPNRRLILQYALFLVGAMVLVFAMVWALEAYAGVTVDGGSSGLVVPMVAAMATAMQWYNGEKQRPARSRIWALTLRCALVTLGLQIGLLLLFYVTGLLDDALHDQSPGASEVAIFAAVLALAALVQVLMIRLGLGLGIKIAEKQARQLAERAARK